MAKNRDDTTLIRVTKTFKQKLLLLKNITNSSSMEFYLTPYVNQELKRKNIKL